MIDNYKDTLDRFAAPNKTFRLIRLDQEILDKWQNELLSNPLHLNDTYRNVDSVRRAIGELLAGSNLSFVFEILRGDDRCGIVIFHHIIPGFKCVMSMQIWDVSAWSKSGVRDAVSLVDLIMKEFDLRRVGAETVDPRVRRMACILGFNEEGEKVNDFLCNGELLNTYVLGRVRGVEED